MNLRLLLSSLFVILSVSAIAQVTKGPHNSVTTKKTYLLGRIVWSPLCTGTCASGRSPRYYKFVDPDTVYEAIGDVLQELGFAVNPHEFKPKDQGLDATKGKDKDSAPSHLFWTDLIPLDAAALQKFNTGRTALRLSTDEHMYYEIQIVFTCRARNPLIEAARENPRETQGRLQAEYGMQSGRELEANRQARTEVEFAFSLLVKKRGLKSTYVDDHSEYDNRPILDWLYKKILERIEQLKPDTEVEAESGGMQG